MIRDITIGQFFPGKSFIHKLDPRTKLLLTIAYIVLLFIVRNPLPMLGCTVLALAFVAIAHIPPKIVLKGVKPILILVAFTAVINMFYTDGGTVLFDWWIFKLTTKGLVTSAVLCVRIVCLIVTTSLLTYTTSPIALTDAIEYLLGPLKYIKVPVHDFAMMMTIALRFIPTLVEETDKIMNAQKARGADIDHGSLIARVKAMIPVLIPLFVSAFRRASDLATAMECRCYRGGEGRTKLKKLSMSLRDLVGFLVFAALFTAVVLLDFVPFLTFA